MNDKLVIGVDGGGTKTLGVVMNGDGEVLAQEKFPSSNIHSNSHETVRDVLGTMFSSIMERAGVSAGEIGAVCLGMAGCDSEVEKRLFEKFTRESIGDEPALAVHNDGAIAIRALHGELRGMVVISGTGSICLGRDGEVEVRAGGWGHLLADEGGGFKIGLEALRAYLAAYDERGPRTSLTGRLDEELGLTEPRDILQHVYGVEALKPKVAALSKIVMEEAEAGDDASIGILTHQADELAKMAGAVQRRLFPSEEAPLGLWGGNLVHGDYYRQLFLRALEDRSVRAHVVLKPDAQAVLGAAECALDMIS